MKHIYLSGPMTGYPDFNRASFHAAAAKLRDEGHWVYNPAEYEYEGDFPLRAAMAEFCHVICTTCDTIAMLPGWESSKGAMVEYKLAMYCGLKLKLLPMVAVVGEAPAHAPA